MSEYEAKQNFRMQINLDIRLSRTYNKPLENEPKAGNSDKQYNKGFCQRFVLISMSTEKSFIR